MSTGEEQQVHTAPAEPTLQRFGYRQELRRALGPFSSFAVALSTISVTTGVFVSMGPILSLGGSAAIWIVGIDIFFMFFVAVTYANIATRIPLTGLEYQWGQRLASPSVGTVLGWLAFVGQPISVVAVNYVLATTVLPPLFGYTSSSNTSIIIAAVLIVVQAIVLGASIKWSSYVTNLAAITEIGIISAVLIALVVVGLIRGHLDGHELVTIARTPGTSYWSVGNLKTIGTFWFGLSIAFFGAATGFQACGNVAEETHRPARIVPRMMVTSLVVSGVAEIGILLVLVASIRPSQLDKLVTSPTVVAQVVGTALGGVVEKIFLAIVAYNIIACGLACYLQAVRYMWAMARDGRFPGHRFLRISHVNPRFRTPLAATVLCLVLMEATLIYFTSHSAVFDNLEGGASLCFLFVFLATIAVYALRGRRLPIVEARFGPRWLEWLSIFVGIAFLLFMIWVLHVPAFKEEWIYLGVLVGIGVLYAVSRVVVRKLRDFDGTERLRPTK